MLLQNFILIHGGMGKELKTDLKMHSADILNERFMYFSHSKAPSRYCKENNNTNL